MHLRMAGISKAFSGVPALTDVTLEVRRGEVHALMGENGAGKSTLMRILAGLCAPDAGQVYLDSRAVSIRSPKDARKLGISMIHQELNPVREMSVAENIFLGREPTRGWFGWVDRRKQRARTAELCRGMDLDVDPDVPAGRLPVASLQMMEIVKAVSDEASILIMDEPTSAIPDREVRRLFGVIRELKARGIAIIYISHKMEEIFQISDTITVLRDGRHIATRPAAELDRDTLVSLMVGRKISELFPPRAARSGPVALQVRGLSRPGEFEDVSFTARRGEVLGFAGLMGAGRTEVMETVFGLRPLAAGSIELDGHPIEIRRPGDAIRHGIALVTEDRKQSGLNLHASVRDNLTLVGLRSFARGGQWIDASRENAAADRAMERLRVKASHRGQIVRTLSGGNQQKVVLAKWLLVEPDVIILDEPTRGIDVGAKAEIYRLIAELAEKGRTVIVVSSEMEEILGLSDRIVVLCRGRVAAELPRGAANPETIMRAAMGTS